MFNPVQQRVIQSSQNDMTSSARILLLLVALGLSGPSLADPVTALFGLLVADKVSTPTEKKQSKNHYSWRELLTTDERQILSGLESNPAIRSCARSADEGDAIAAYHMRKIANFSVRLDRHIEDNGSVPMLGSMDYQWPAKGMLWCDQKFGAQSSKTSLTLQAYALRLTALVQGLSTGQAVVVARQH